MLIETNAIVLKRIAYSETSIICRMLTENFGKVSVLSKGAWRSKKAFGPILEPPNHVYIQYYHNPEQLYY